MNKRDESDAIQAMSNATVALKTQEAVIKELRDRIAAIEAQNMKLIEALAAKKQEPWYTPYIGNGSYTTTRGSCLHDNCPTCHGTGTGPFGPCVHGISCPCPKCSPTCSAANYTTTGAVQ